jgi:hypothetical protein
MASLDGSCFFLTLSQDARIFARAFDGATGAERWSIEVPTSLAPQLAHDPEGKLVSCFPYDRKDRGVLLDMATGKQLRQLSVRPLSLSPRAAHLVVAPPGGTARGFVLQRQGDDEPVVQLGIDPTPSCPTLFSHDGRRLAWGTSTARLACVMSRRCKKS